MGDYEIEIDDSTSTILAAIAGSANEDALSLARIAEIDPEEFRRFLAEYGETENEDALELLRAAESLRFVRRQSLAESFSQKRESIWTRLKYLLMGGGIGAVFGLLFAPRPGYELRGDIADATRKGIDRSREAAQELGGRAEEYYEATRERASELYSQAADRVSEVAQTARETAARNTSTVAAAIEAGKKASRDEKRKTEMSGSVEAAPNYGEEAN